MADHKKHKKEKSKSGDSSIGSLLKKLLPGQLQKSIFEDVAGKLNKAGKKK